MKVSQIKNPVSSIAGIGPQFTKYLAKVNVFTVGDLLQYYPRDYEDRTKRVFLKDFNGAAKIHTVAKVISHQWFGYGQTRTLKIAINDSTANAELICFNRGFLEKVLIPGSVVTVTGQFFVKYNVLQSSSFEVEVMKVPADSDVEKLTPLGSKILPIYPLTEGLTQKSLENAISQAILQYSHGIEDEIPPDLIEKRGLLHKRQALKFIHEPQTMAQAISAKKTLSYEELFLFQSTLIKRIAKRKGKSKIAENFIPPEISTKFEASKKSSQSQENAPLSDDDFYNSLSPLQQTFFNSLPFELTSDQKKVIYEIDEETDKSYKERERLLNRLEKGLPPPAEQPFSMARLVQGDVGSGKTLVSLFACLRTISWKGQCAFMAPTEILARQHAETISKLFGATGIRIAFLTGNVKSKGRNRLLKSLKDGDLDIIVGTHALFSQQVIYKDLRLTVIDEQHRFGVLQRQAIINKGRFSAHGMTFEQNLLMMSATPIPQSLALTMFGDLDISTIRAKPLGRKEIQTYLVKEGNEINAYEAVRKELEKGRQAYFVYPAIDSDENIKSAQKAFEFLSEKIYPQYECAILHSKIPEERQEEILRQFYDGEIQVLAATTVIEVGIDVPNATSIVIEQADRFGMAQLHQLRGRVGRGSEQSYCYLIYGKNITQTGIERMKALRQSTDGFYIAEQDLKTRGPGELNGTIQAGALEFKIADLSRDMPLLNDARNDAFSKISEISDL